MADRLWLVADGTCRSYDDDLEAYRNLIVQQRRKEREQVKQAARNKEQGKKGDKSPEDQARQLEQKSADLAQRKDAMENEMAVCSANGDAKQLKRLNNSYISLQKELEATERELETLIATL